MSLNYEQQWQENWKGDWSKELTEDLLAEIKGDPDLHRDMQIVADRVLSPKINPACSCCKRMQCDGCYITIREGYDLDSLINEGAEATIALGEEMESDVNPWDKDRISSCKDQRNCGDCPHFSKCN